MNICPICDSQIEGKWCKHCHRFVTPLAVGSGIHFNEEHDIKHETNCEYHDTSNVDQKPDSQYKREIQERRRQMDERQRASGVTADNRVTGKPSTAQRRKKKKKKKGASGFVVAAIVIWFLMGIIPDFFFQSIIDKVKEMNSENVDSRQQEVQVTSAQVEEVTAGSESGQETSLYRAARLLRAMESVTKPIDSYQTEMNGYSGTTYVYDEEDIEKIGFCCDGLHFDQTYEDIIDLINNGNTVYYVNMKDILDAGTDNFLFDTGTSGFAYFARYYDITGDGVEIWLDVDTATGQVHGITITSQDLDSIGFQVAAYEFVNEFIPAYYQGLGAMTEDFRKGLESQTPVEIIVNGFDVVYYGQPGYSNLTIVPANEN